MTEEDTDLRLEIDPDRLDSEWITHPKMMYEWSVKAADAQSEYDTAKSRLDVTTANLDQEIRENPGNYGVGKVTEGSVKTTVQNQPEYAAAVKAVIAARHALQVAQAACTALEHRKRALTLLVELYVHAYYAHPQLRPMSNEGEEWSKRALRRRGMRRSEDGTENGD